MSSKEQALPYRAHLVFDFGSKVDTNAFQRMESALVNLQWTYVETSAFVFDQPQGMTDNQALTAIWQGIATFARGSAAIGGVLSALTYTIQRIDQSKMGQTSFGGATNPTISFTDLSQNVFPGDANPGN